jgi:hypothetical protein
LGFSACGGPTYMFPCHFEMRNPTTADVQTETQRFLFLINLAVFLASGPPEAEHLKPFIINPINLINLINSINLINLITQSAVIRVIC